MKTLICFTAFIFLLSTFAINVEKEGQTGQISINKPVTINWSNLKQFGNYTGKTFGQTELKSLITYINNASAIYGTDVANTMKYIKTVMDAMFGDLNNQYNVAIENVPTRDFGNATIYCQDGTNFAYIGYGVNLRYPTLTYLVYKAYTPGSAYNYLTYILNRGSGLTVEQGSKINYIIQAIDGPTACDCTRTYQILIRLQNVIDARWNVICQSTPNIYSYVAITNSTWIMTKPETCTYFIYAI